MLAKLEENCGAKNPFTTTISKSIRTKVSIALMVHHRAHPVIALHDDDKRTSTQILKRWGLVLVGQDESAASDEGGCLKRMVATLPSPESRGELSKSYTAS